MEETQGLNKTFLKLVYYAGWSLKCIVRQCPSTCRCTGSSPRYVSRHKTGLRNTNVAICGLCRSSRGGDEILTEMGFVQKEKKTEEKGVFLSGRWKGYTVTFNAESLVFFYDVLYDFVSSSFFCGVYLEFMESDGIGISNSLVCVTTVRKMYTVHRPRFFVLCFS